MDEVIRCLTQSTWNKGRSLIAYIRWASGNTKGVWDLVRRELSERGQVSSINA